MKCIMNADFLLCPSALTHLDSTDALDDLQYDPTFDGVASLYFPSGYLKVARITCGLLRKLVCPDASYLEAKIYESQWRRLTNNSCVCDESLMHWRSLHTHFLSFQH